MNADTEAPDFQYDLGGTEPASQLGGFAPIPSGIYIARVLDPVLGASKAGNLQIKFEWQVLSGDYSGQKVRDQITFTPKSGPFVLAYMVGLGLQRPTVPVPAKTLAAYVARGIDNRVAQITVGLRSYTANDGTLKQTNEVINIAASGPFSDETNRPFDQLSEEDAADVPF